MARPRGYAPWNPKPDSIALLGQVAEILREYSAQLPLTARQIFYRLVGAYDYDKTEKAYSNLCEKLVRARRAEMLPFDAIRDDGTSSMGGGGYSGPDGFFRTVRESAERYERNYMLDQQVRVELWCEAAGMLPQMAAVADPYSIRSYSTGGFSSVTVTHEIAARAARFEGETIILHVGDYDPSGESIFESMTDDARQFVLADAPEPETDLIPIRVALTGEQVDEHDLPTAPPKASDSRSANWQGDTCQAEAMPPDLLAETVREAIEQVIDLDALAESVKREETEKEEILSKLAALE